MIAIDTNILVYAHREELPLHRKAKARLVELAEGIEPWGLPVFCVGEFLRVVTHPRVFDPPSTIRQGVEAIGNLLESPSCVILNPAASFWTILAETARGADAKGNILYDAQIVAVCREHGVVDILSEDRDFCRFEGITLQTL
jgi:toxin-antitoxin system PIN domain toxin